MIFAALGYWCGLRANHYYGIDKDLWQGWFTRQTCVFIMAGYEVMIEWFLILSYIWYTLCHLPISHFQTT